MGYVQYYTEKQSMKRVFFPGTDTLRTGYALCYDRDNITADARGAGLHGGATELANGADLTAGYRNYERHTNVEKPTVTNRQWFAGVVAPSSDGHTGPTWVDIVEPSAVMRSVEAFCEESTTINATQLTVKAGTYALGGIADGGPIVAEALQTLDRSSTNGLIQVGLFPVNSTADLAMSPRGRAVTALPTAAIWKNFPLGDMRANPMVGTLFETDFTRPVGAFGLASTAATLGDIYADTATCLVRTSPGAAGIGELVLTGGAAHDGIQWRVPCPITVSGAAGVAGNPWAFEARVAIGNITVGQNAGLFFGLFDGDAALASTEVADTTGILGDKGLVGFNTLAATTETLRRSYRNSGQAVQATAGLKTAVATTYFTAGMYYDGVTIAVYIDGVVNATGVVSNANLIEATPLFPQAEELAVLFSMKQLAAAATGLLSVDWVRVAQLI